MTKTQEKTMEWRNKIRSVIAPLLIEELRRSGTMDKVAHATLLSNMTDELYALLASSQDSFRRKVEEKLHGYREHDRKNWSTGLFGSRVKWYGEGFDDAINYVKELLKGNEPN